MRRVGIALLFGLFVAGAIALLIARPWAGTSSTPSKHAALLDEPVPWKADHLQKVAEALKGQCDELPRLGQPAFQRLLSSENLRALAFVPSNLGALLDYGDALKSVMKTYLECAHYPESHLVVAVLYEWYAELNPVLAEFMKTIPTTDPSYQTRKEGQQKVYLGLRGMLVGQVITMTSQGDPKLLRPAVVRLGRAIRALRKTTPEEFTKPALVRLKESAVEHRVPAMRDVLGDLVSEIER